MADKGGGEKKGVQKGGGGKKENCCQKGCRGYKNCFGRIPWASLLAGILMIASFTLLLIALQMGLERMDKAFKIIGTYSGSYRKYRNMIATIMQTAVYSTYAFVGFFLLIAFLCSGKNRDCLKKNKCCRRHILMFVVIIMIVLAILYFVTLLSVSSVGVPLTVATITVASCDAFKAGLNAYHSVASLLPGVGCMNLEFLGSDKPLCKGSDLDEFCKLMKETVVYAWLCWVALIFANIAIVIALTAFGSNYAYIQSVKHELKADPEAQPIVNSKSGTGSKGSKGERQTQQTPITTKNNEESNLDNKNKQAPPPKQQQSLAETKTDKKLTETGAENAPRPASTNQKRRTTRKRVSSNRQSDPTTTITQENSAVNSNAAAITAGTSGAAAGGGVAAGAAAGSQNKESGKKSSKEATGVNEEPEKENEEAKANESEENSDTDYNDKVRSTIAS